MVMVLSQLCSLPEYSPPVLCLAGSSRCTSEKEKTAAKINAGENCITLEETALEMLISTHLLPSLPTLRGRRTVLPYGFSSDLFRNAKQTLAS